MTKTTRQGIFQPKTLALAVALGIASPAYAVTFNIGEVEGQLEIFQMINHLMAAEVEGQLGTSQMANHLMAAPVAQEEEEEELEVHLNHNREVNIITHHSPHAATSGPFTVTLPHGTTRIGPSSAR